MRIRRTSSSSSRHRPRGHGQGPQGEISCLPRRHAAHRASPCGAGCPACRIAAITNAASTSTTAVVPQTQMLGEEGRGFDLDERLARRDAPHRRRHQRRPGAARARPRRCNGPPNAQAVRRNDRPFPGRLVPARRHGDRDRRRRPPHPLRRLEARRGAATPTATIAVRPSSIATEMLARVTDRAIQIYGGMGLDGASPRSSAGGATRGSSASGTAPARSSATSSAATSCGRLGA